MSLRFASEHLADLRHDARLLAERADDQEGQPEAARRLLACPTQTLFAAVLTKPVTPDAVLAPVQDVAGL